MTGSNRRHSRCKRDALPTELIAPVAPLPASARQGAANEPAFQSRCRCQTPGSNASAKAINARRPSASCRKVGPGGRQQAMRRQWHRAGAATRNSRSLPGAMDLMHVRRGAMRGASGQSARPCAKVRAARSSHNSSARPGHASGAGARASPAPSRPIRPVGHHPPAAPGPGRSHRPRLIPATRPTSSADPPARRPNPQKAGADSRAAAAQ